MRVLIRDEQGRYYKSAEAWTMSPGSAADFKTTLVAMEFARENGFSKSEVVLSFDDPAYDMTLSIRGV